MSDFTFYDRAEIEQGQSNKEVTANDAIEALAKASGFLALDLTAAGATLNLTQEQSEYGFIKLYGAPAAGVTVVKLAGTTNTTIFSNETTGGFTINVKMSGGTSFAVALLTLRWLLSSTVSYAVTYL